MKNENIQNQNYGIWLVKSLKGDSATFALVDRNAQPCYGKTVDELIAIQYVAKNTGNKFNIESGLIGNSNVSKFVAEFICESDNRAQLLRTKKYLNKSLK
jgi:hypothetical protein